MRYMYLSFKMSIYINKPFNVNNPAVKCHVLNVALRPKTTFHYCFGNFGMPRVRHSVMLLWHT